MAVTTTQNQDDYWNQFRKLPVARPARSGGFSEAGKGARAFVDETQALGGGALALGAQAAQAVIPDVIEPEFLGDVRQKGLDIYSRNIAESQVPELRPKVARIEDVKLGEEGGFGRLADWAAFHGTKGLGTVATLAVPGGVGAAVGKTLVKSAIKKTARDAGLKHAQRRIAETGAKDQVAKGMIKEAAKKQAGAADVVRKAQVRGATTGATAGAFGLEGGSSFGQLTDEGVSPEDALVPSLAVGTVNAALELTPWGIAAKHLGLGKVANAGIKEAIKGDPKLKKLAINIAKGIGVGASTEAATEGLQELVQLAGERWAKDDPVFQQLSEEDWSAIKNAAAVGGLVGGGIGGTLGPFKGAAEVTPEAVPDAAPEAAPAAPAAPTPEAPITPTITAPSTAERNQVQINWDMASPEERAEMLGTKNKQFLEKSWEDLKPKQQERVIKKLGPTVAPEQATELEAQAPGFYSPTSAAIQALPQTKGTGPQMLQQLLKKRGTKEEMDAMHMEEWLMDQGKVTKEEMEKFVKEGGIKVDEVVKRAGEEGANELEFADYQEPSGENYQELLLTVPETDSNFQSIHFTEPNILAHIRSNEREDAEGNRVLFLEEIQSDWHQKGKKQGYRDVDEKTVPLEAKKGFEGNWLVESPEFDAPIAIFNYEANTPEEAVAVARERISIGPLGAQLKAGRVPDAPFKKSWPLLAFKRMLREAAEKGFDKIAWKKDPQMLKRTGGWADLEQNEQGQWFAHGRNVTTIVERYTKRLPQIVNKYAKQQGWEIRTKAALISFGPVELSEDAFLQPDEGVWQASRDGVDVREFPTEAEAGEFLRPEAGGLKEVWSLQITPEMREDILGKGQPLFAEAEEAPTGLTSTQVREGVARAMSPEWVKQAEVGGFLEIVEGVNPDNPHRLGGWNGERIRLYSGALGGQSPAEGVILHEGTHAGFDVMLDRSGDKYRGEIQTLIERKDPIAVRAAKQALKVSNERFPNQTQEANRAALYNAELIAYYMQYVREEGTSTGTFRRLVNDIKAWFAQTDFGQWLKNSGLGFKLTDEMAVALARQATQFGQELREVEQVHAPQLESLDQIPLVAKAAQDTGVAAYNAGYDFRQPSSWASLFIDLSLSDAQAARIAKELGHEDFLKRANATIERVAENRKTRKKQYRDSFLISQYVARKYIEPLENDQVLRLAAANQQEGMSVYAARDVAFKAVTQAHNRSVPPKATLADVKRKLDELRKAAEKPRLRLVDEDPSELFSELATDYTAGIDSLLQKTGGNVAEAAKRLATATAHPATQQLAHGKGELHFMTTNKLREVGVGDQIRELVDGFYDPETKTFLSREDAKQIAQAAYGQTSRPVDEEKLESQELRRTQAEAEAPTKLPGIEVEEATDIDAIAKELSPEARAQLEEFLGQQGAFDPNSESILESQADWDYREALIGDTTSLGKLSNLYLNYVDRFSGLDKQAPDVASEFDLALTRGSAAQGDIERELSIPIQEIFKQNKQWDYNEVDTALAARHIVLDDQNRKLAVEASLTEVDKLIKSFKKNRQTDNAKELKRERDKIYANRNGDSKEVVQQDMFNLFEDWIEREPVVDGEQSQWTQWKEFKDHAAGLSTGEGTNVQNVKNARTIYDNWKDDRDFQRVAALADKTAKHILDLKLAGGLITEESYAALQRSKPHYVPLRREAFDYETLLARTGMSGGSGLLTRVGTAEAGHEPVHVLQNLLAHAHVAAMAAENNLARQYMAAQIKANPEAWNGWFKVAKDKEKAKMDKFGFTGKTKHSRPELIDISFTLKGQRLLIQPTKENQRATSFVRAVNNLDAKELEGPMKLMGMVNKLVRAVNITLSPAFITANAIRDPLTAAYNLKATEADGYVKEIFKEYGSSIRALGKTSFGKARETLGTANEDPDALRVQAWEKAGGKISYIQGLKEMDTSSFDTFEKMVVRSQKGPGIGKLRLPPSIFNAAKQGLENIENFNMMMENVMRLSAFTVLTRLQDRGGAGLDAKVGARVSKDMTTNFTRKGYKSAAMNTWWLFFNATVQGNRQVIVNAMKSRPLQGMIAGTMAFSAMVDAIGRAVGDEDEDKDGKNDWDAIPHWEKERFIHFPVKVAGAWLKMPAPWVYNVVWRAGQVPGEALAGVDGKDITTGMADLARMSISTLNPIAGGTVAQSIAPTALDPVVQVWENRDFVGNPLGPANFPGDTRPDSQKAWSSTPAPFRSGAELLNKATGGSAGESGFLDVRPSTLKVAHDFFGGGLLRFFENFGGAAWKAADPDEEIKLHKVPVIRQFATIPYDTLGTQLYHDRQAKVRQAVSGLRRLSEGPDRNLIEARDLRIDKAAILRMDDYAKDVERQIKDLRKSIRLADKRGNSRQADRFRDRIKKLQGRFNEAWKRRVGN